MENQFVIPKKTLALLAQYMAKKNEDLQKIDFLKFESNFEQLIQQKADMASISARCFKQMFPSAKLYTYLDTFPTDTYNALSPESIQALELFDVYISKDEELDFAYIRIIFHF